MRIMFGPLDQRMNIFWNSARDGFAASGPTSSEFIAATNTHDAGTYEAGGIMGAVGGHALHGQYYAFANAGQCQFSASGIAN